MPRGQHTETKALLQSAIESNKLHQQELAAYAQRLEDEIANAEKLMAEAEQEDDGEMQTATVEIPGSKKPAGFIPSSSFLNPASPFYAEASRRVRYLSATNVHPMSKRELEALEEGVKESNHRRLAFEAKRNGKPFWDIDTADLLTNTEDLDWARIAEKVSDASGNSRTPKECETKWLGDRHPTIRHDAWDKEESIKMVQLLDGYEAGKFNWKEVSENLATGRTPFDCMRHGMPKPHHYWDSEADAALCKAVAMYGIDNWNLVARHVSPQVTAAQCQIRFTKSLDTRVRKGGWSDEEDDRLRLAVEVYGNVWLDVASVMHGRINEQCRDRWVSKLDPALNKTAWTEEEDAALMEAYNELGKKWSDISKRLKNKRTDIQCRRRVEQLNKQKVNELKAAEKVAATQEKTRLADEKAKLNEIRRQETRRRRQEAKQNPGIRFMEPQTSSTPLPHRTIQPDAPPLQIPMHIPPALLAPALLANAHLIQQLAVQQGISIVPIGAIAQNQNATDPGPPPSTSADT
ncbi:hypothetical protein ONZ45_g4556 [Pleurotus djamor]|nr:hypothetical protein ONZ45_g4556 [Pleurotus djamor]